MADLNELSLEEILNKLIEEGFDYCRNSRECKNLSDEDFINLCCIRTLGDFQSGRDFLQHQLEVEEHKISCSTFFDALGSDRRLLMTEEVSKGMETCITRYLTISSLACLKFYSIDVNTFATPEITSPSTQPVTPPTESNRSPTRFLTH